MRFSDLISLIIDNLSRRKDGDAHRDWCRYRHRGVVTLVSLGAGLQASATSNLWVSLTWQVCRLALAIRNINRNVVYRRRHQKDYTFRD